MFEQIREWVLNNQRASFLIGLAVFGAVALVLAGGVFNIQFSQFFAVEPGGECTVAENCDDGDACTRDRCTARGVCVNNSISGCDPTNPPTQDQGTVACNPVTAPGWNAAGSPQCTPFPTPPAITPPPLPPNYLPHADVTLAQRDRTCLGFTLADNQWAPFDARSGGKLATTAGKISVKGTVFNNCPWPVQLKGGAAGSPKAGKDFIFKVDGTVDEPVTGLNEMTTRVAPPATSPEIPSCWNYAHLPAAGPRAGCQVGYELSLDAGIFNSGRVEASLGWRHMTQSGPGGRVDQDGYNIVLDYGRDCTSAGPEKCPTSGVGGTGKDGISGPGPGGSFNCGTGESSNACWCGEWTDNIWAQRHANAACQCDPGFIIDASLAGPTFDPASNPGAIGKTCSDFQDWSRTEVQNFIDVMEQNFPGGNQSCNPRSSGVDYAAIQQTYFAIGGRGWGSSGNGTSAVAARCKDSSGTQAAVLKAVCTNNKPPILLTWNIPTGSVANGLIKRTNGGEGQFISDIGRFQTNYTDTAVQAGNTYEYTHKSHASVASTPVSVTVDASGNCSQISPTTPTPTTVVSTRTPTPSAVASTRTPVGAPSTTGAGGPGGQAGVAAGAQTGPAAATFLAFMLSSVAALLYVSYTHTSLFRRREARKVSGGRDPMDFRS